MEAIENLVDKAIDAFNARRRTGMNLTSVSLISADKELERWHGLVESRLKAFRHSDIDRGLLLSRGRRRFKGKEWAADFAGIADELQEMIRDDLRKHLADNGMPDEAAQRLVKGYSIGALLHDS